MALTKVKLIADGVVNVDHLAANHGITTDNIGEGSALYYTDARVSSYLTTNSYATEGFVTTAVSNLVDAAPSTLDTLNELAAALGDDPNFATTVTNSIATKLPLTGGTLTGDINTASKINFTGTPSSGVPYTFIQHSYNGGGNCGIRLIAHNPNNGVDSDLEFQVMNSAANYITPLYLDGSTGNVGIGTVSPTNGKLEVQQTDTNAALWVQTGGTTDSYTIADFRTGTNAPALTIKGNANVGIGYTSPVDKLQVAGNIRIPNGSAFKASYDNSNDFYHGSLEWAALQLGNNGGNRIIAGRTGGGGSLSFYTNNTNNAADYTTNPDGILTMHLSNSGQVGIGVTAPGMPLHVKGYDSYSSFGNNMVVIEDSVGDYSGILMSGSSGRNAAIRTEGGNDITFWTNLDRNTNWYKAMTILSGGNVGIGTPLADSKLTIVSSGRTDDIRMLATNGGTTNSYIGNFGGGTYIATNYFYSGGHYQDDNTKGSFELFMGDSNLSISYMDPGAAGNRLRRISIDSLGRIGIGTNTPSYTFDVIGGSASGIRSYSTGFACVDIESNRTSGNIGGIRWETAGDIYKTSEINSIVNGGLAFRTGDGSTTSPTDRMYITGSGNIGVNRTDPSAKLDTKGAIRQSNTDASFSRVQSVHGQTGGYSSVKVIFDKTNWGSVTYDIKVASAGGTYHTAGAYYSNPGFSNDLVSISTGNGMTVSKTAANASGGTQGATWTFTAGSIIHPIVTVDIACGNGFQVTEDSIIVQFIP